MKQIYYNFALLNNFVVTFLLAYQTYLVIADKYLGAGKRSLCFDVYVLC